MKEDLLPYYENELSFIRGLGKEFAAAYGKIARRLALEPDKCEDPHVERLIESFALLAGRRPFHGSTNLEVLETIIHAVPEPLGGGSSAGLRTLVEKALEKDPAGRPTTGTALARMLHVARNGKPL